MLQYFLNITCLIRLEFFKPFALAVYLNFLLSLFLLVCPNYIKLACTKYLSVVTFVIRHPTQISLSIIALPL